MRALTPHTPMRIAQRTRRVRAAASATTATVIKKAKLAQLAQLAQTPPSRRPAPHTTPMSDTFSKLDRRIESAIRRVPDRLTDHPDIRADWARAFAQCLGAAQQPVRMFGCLPFHLHLMTDPHLFRLYTGFVVLDHPETVGEFEECIYRGRVQVHDIAKWHSLYENRHPRLISIPDKGKIQTVADMINRLRDFHGPFEAPPKWQAVGSSVFRVEYPVDPAWFESLARRKT